jgi:hypothetical protein
MLKGMIKIIQVRFSSLTAPIYWTVDSNLD